MGVTQGKKSDDRFVFSAAGKKTGGPPAVEILQVYNTVQETEGRTTSERKTVHIYLPGIYIYTERCCESAPLLASVPADESCAAACVYWKCTLVLRVCNRLVMLDLPLKYSIQLLFRYEV